MTLISRILNMFGVVPDSDLYDNATFKMTFSNVINFIMLLQSLQSGLYAMLEEDMLLASLNLLFSLFFIMHFVVSFFIKNSHYMEIMDKVAIFSFFIVLFVTCGYHKIIGLTMTLYPFIAIIMHGRRTGAVLTIVQSGFVLLYYFLSVWVFELDAKYTYSFLATLMIIALQFVSLFVYYIAVRWLTGLIYGRNREVSILSDELRVKSDLIDKLTNGIDKPLREIVESSSILTTERLNSLQAELVSLIRASSQNAMGNLNAIVKASARNIPMVAREITRFNLYTMVGGLLKLYKSSGPDRRHTYALGSNVPEIVVGNSILTRQVLLNILDALDNRAGLSEYGVKILVTREDFFEHDIKLRFCVSIDCRQKFHERDVPTSRILEYLELDVTKRIVESENQLFSINLDQSGLHIDFTLKYRSEEDYLGRDVRLSPTVKVGIDRAGVIRDMTILFMTADDMLWTQFNDAMGKYVGSIRRAHSVKEAEEIFTNSLVDVVVADIGTDRGQGKRLVSLVRKSESGIVRKVPTISIANPEDKKEVEEASLAGFDSNMLLPIEEKVVRAMVSSFFV